MSELCNAPCNTWISFCNYGIPTAGCLHDLSWLSVYCPLIDDTVKFIDMHDEVLHRGIYTHKDTINAVFIKRISMLFTVYMQALIGDWLEGHGFPCATMPIARMFTKDQSMWYAMYPIPGSFHLESYLEEQENIGCILTDCLVQLCCMMWQLSELGVDYGHITPSNLLITPHAPCKKTYTIDGIGLTLDSGHLISFIHVDHMRLSSRDLFSTTNLFVFLGNIYVQFHTKLSPILCEFIEYWTDAQLCAFMRRDTIYSQQWLELMSDRFHKNAHPTRILFDLQGIQAFLDSPV